MKLAFYLVDNSQEYDRHTFDNVYDNPQKIQELLDKLPPEEVRYYDINPSTHGIYRTPDLLDFKEDYNDEVLDGGWWVVLIP